MPPVFIIYRDSPPLIFMLFKAELSRQKQLGILKYSKAVTYEHLI